MSAHSNSNMGKTFHIEFGKCIHTVCQQYVYFHDMSPMPIEIQISKRIVYTFKFKLKSKKCPYTYMCIPTRFILYFLSLSNYNLNVILPCTNNFICAYRVRTYIQNVDFWQLRW